METRGLVQAYSYWTFSDIFEENYFPSVPFHGGFGLLNIHGIAKPAYRAFELLHRLGTEVLEVEGLDASVDVWLVRGQGSATVLLTNFALPRQIAFTKTVEVSLGGAVSIETAILRRIDTDHANPRALWEQMGMPEYLSPALVTELHGASGLAEEVQQFTWREGRIHFELSLSPQSVAAIEFTYESA
jgi:xylan 1,4-beta-xylosidase